MEHQQYDLLWKLQTKFPNSINSFQPPPYFQESFVWPPRSYRCSFCRREFRSAQALGGHMNVHRRDRARLKQSPPPQQPQQDYSLLFQEKSNLLAPQILFTPPPNVVDEECDSEEDDDFVGKRHKFMCSSERFSSMEEIDLELRLGYPAVKL